MSVQLSVAKTTEGDASNTSTEASSLPVKKRFDFSATTGVRGVCALVVIAGNFFHYFCKPADDLEDFQNISLDYHTAVTLFFVISGVLMASLYNGKLEGPWRHDRNFGQCEILG